MCRRRPRHLIAVSWSPGGNVVGESRVVTAHSGCSRLTAVTITRIAVSSIAADMPVCSPRQCRLVSNPGAAAIMPGMTGTRLEPMHVETDVLIIGSGGAGMYAAIEAVRAGCSVFLAERSLI